jgi:hypothetical protein
MRHRDPHRRPGARTVGVRAHSQLPQRHDYGRPRLVTDPAEKLAGLRAEGNADERMPQRVRSGRLGDPGAASYPADRRAAPCRSSRCRSGVKKIGPSTRGDGQVDRPRDARRERDGDDLAALPLTSRRRPRASPPGSGPMTSPRTTVTTCPGRDRHGRHEGGHPGAGVVLARQHGRLGADPPGQDDMRDWTLSRIVWVADRGFTSAENRRYLRAGDHHYIVGEKLRSGSAEATAALSRQGRYQDVAANLRVKEVRISEHERFVICYNPEAADRDAKVRERMLTQLGEMIKDSDKLSATKRAELRGVISTKPGLNRYCATPPAGCCAPTPPRSRPRRTWTASTCSAAPTPSCPPRTSRPATSNSWKSSAAGATSSRSSTCARSTTARKNASAPTSSCTGLPCCSSASPRPPPERPGPRSPTSCTCSPSARSPARPARSGRPPSSPRPSATCSPSSRSRPRRRSSRPARQLPDQQRRSRLVTRPVTIPARIHAGHTPDPGTMTDAHLRNPGIHLQNNSVRFLPRPGVSRCRAAEAPG